MLFGKTAITIMEQIAQLEGRGMTFNNKEKAAHYLSNISYYRISAYWFTFLEEPISENKFKDGTTFEKIIQTYVFDRKLRILIFDEIERIEIALRTQIIYHFAHEFGNNWYEDHSLFICKEYYDKMNELLHDEMDRTSEKFISAYRKKYTMPRNPPCWMVLELASFGQLSSMYKNLKGCSAKRLVAEHFNLDDTILISWLETLSYLRNRSAHHSRLWNKKMPKRLKMPSAPKSIWISVLPDNDKLNRIYLGMAAILYLLRSIVPTTKFAEKLIQLLDNYPDLPRHYMGFPDGWKEDKFWEVSTAKNDDLEE